MFQPFKSSPEKQAMKINNLFLYGNSLLRTFFPVDLTLQDPVLYISFPLLWSLLDFFAGNSDAEAVFNDAGECF